MAGFRFLEHTSDVYIEASGDTLENAFIHAANALFETMTDLKSIEPKESHQIKIKSEDLNALLFDWINQFLYFFDVNEFVFSKFEIEIKKVGSGYELWGTCWGERFDPQKHPARTEIKAPTYSLMEIIQDHMGVVLRFVVDI
ncbi:MAG: archease [Promethearchaeota archaeon]